MDIVLQYYCYCCADCPILKCVTTQRDAYFEIASLSYSYNPIRLWECVTIRLNKIYANNFVNVGTEFRNVLKTSPGKSIPQDTVEHTGLFFRKVSCTAYEAPSGMFSAEYGKALGAPWLRQSAGTLPGATIDRSAKGRHLSSTQGQGDGLRVNLGQTLCVLVTCRLFNDTAPTTNVI
jgi:hypothetical protein